MRQARASAEGVAGRCLAAVLLAALLLGPAPLAASPLRELRPVVLDPPQRWISRAKDGGGPNLLVPSLELVGLNVAVWGVDRLLGKDYAKISPSTMWHNLSTQDWRWDNDPYVSNFLAHPYQGAMPFTAARSSGLGFWASTPFALVSSLMWEVLLENNAPSPNDVILTTLGGIMAGEALHQMSLLVLDTGGPTFPRWLLASLLNPVGSFNHYFFGRKEGDFFTHPPYFARLLVGGSTAVSNNITLNGVQADVPYGPQLLLGFDLVSGLPGVGHWKPQRPFDHYVVNARLGLVRDAFEEVYARALLVGTDFTLAQVQGVWGLFGGYDFANPNTLRISTVSLGAGVAAQAQLTSRLAFLPTLVLSAVPFGGGGTIPFYVDDRNYHYGPGAQSLVELQFVQAGLGRIGVDWRAYFLSGAFQDEGWELISHLTPFAELALGAHNGLGVSGFFGDRDSHFPGAVPNTTENTRQLTLYWTLLTGDAFDSFQRSDP